MFGISFFNLGWALRQILNYAGLTDEESKITRATSYFSRILESYFLIYFAAYIIISMKRVKSTVLLPASIFNFLESYLFILLHIGSEYYLVIVQGGHLTFFYSLWWACATQVSKSRVLGERIFLEKMRGFVNENLRREIWNFGQKKRLKCFFFFLNRAHERCTYGKSVC